MPATRIRDTSSSAQSRSFCQLEGELVLPRFRLDPQRGYRDIGKFGRDSFAAYGHAILARGDERRQWADRQPERAVGSGDSLRASPALTVEKHLGVCERLAPQNDFSRCYAGFNRCDAILVWRRLS